MTDGELLLACSLAGPPGSRSHDEAVSAYWRSITEWRERDAEWRRQEAEAAVSVVLEDVAGVVFRSAMLRRPS